MLQTLQLINQEMRLTKKSRVLQKQLGLDAGILKRFKSFASKNNDLKHF